MNHSMIPEDIRKLSRERSVEFHRQSKNPKPEKIEPGQIWSTFSRIVLSDHRGLETDNPRIVVILFGDDQSSEISSRVITAPISVQVAMATQFDLICGRGTSSLGFDFIAEVWNETPTLKNQLRRYLGSLNAETTTSLLELYKYQLMDEEVPASLLNSVGPRLMGEEDPRFAFQEAEVEAAAYLAEAATAVLSLESADTEVSPGQDPVSEKRHFSTRPLLKRLADVLHQPRIAYAASLDVEKTWVVAVSKGQDYATFELLSSRMPPYNVYLVAYEISPSLIGLKCVVTIKTVEQQLESDPSELQTGNEIRVGEVYPFKPDQVEAIEIKIQ